MTGHDSDEKGRQAEPSFKFVDRRRVDESGESRSSGEEIPPTFKKAEPMAQETSPVNTGLADAAEDEDPANGPITFSLFLQSLAQQTLMAMGVIPWPDSGLIKANLDHARETIDILTILHEKTKGNLTPSEQRFFDSVLYELRVTFVQLLERGSR